MIVEPARLAGLSLLLCQTDERLVDLARAGNVRAFEAIVDRYHHPLLRYCGRLLPSARAEDVVQQAFLNAYGGLHRDDRRIDLRPWLYRIAHNAALNALRENGWSHDRLESALAGTDTTHEAVERRASLEIVLHAVQMLPERQRDAMILRELEGRSYEQIAIELNATGGAVRQLLHRARHTLRAAATAVTPVGAVARLPVGGGAVAERVSDAAAHETLRTSAGKLAGGVVATLAVAAGLSDAPQRLHLPPLERSPRSSNGAAAATRHWAPLPAGLAAGRAAGTAPGTRVAGSGLTARIRPRLSPDDSVVVGIPSEGVTFEPRGVAPRPPRTVGELAPESLPPVVPDELPPSAPADPIPEAVPDIPPGHAVKPDDPGHNRRTEGGPRPEQRPVDGDHGAPGRDDGSEGAPGGGPPAPKAQPVDAGIPREGSEPHASQRRVARPAAS